MYALTATGEETTKKYGGAIVRTATNSSAAGVTVSWWFWILDMR